MQYIFTFFAILFITSIWGLPSPSNAETQSCYGNRWGGTNCVEIRYQLILDRQLQAPGEIQKQFQIFESIAEEKELKTIVMDGSNFDLHSNQQNSGKTWTLDGWVVYRLASPKEAQQFVDVLQGYQYNASQHKQETCYHYLTQRRKFYAYIIFNDHYGYYSTC